MFKGIEDALGRDRSGKKDGSGSIGLDLIAFNNQIVDDDVFKRDFLQGSIRKVLPRFAFPN